MQETLIALSLYVVQVVFLAVSAVKFLGMAVHLGSII